MGKCNNCGKEIDDKYKYCLDCMNKYKEDKPESNDELVDIITKVNWNLGSIQKWMKLSLLNELEKQKNPTETQKNLHALLKKDIEKDLKVIKEISDEQDKK